MVSQFHLSCSLRILAVRYTLNRSYSGATDATVLQLRGERAIQLLTTAPFIIVSNEVKGMQGKANGSLLAS